MAKDFNRYFLQDDIRGEKMLNLGQEKNIHLDITSHILGCL